MSVPFKRLTPAQVNKRHYELVIIGSGFGSLFFLHQALPKLKGRALILEWGEYHPWEWQIKQQSNSAMSSESTYQNRGVKPWGTTVALGGGLNCWYAQTPRMLPADFKLFSRYGVAFDWPLDYSELEPYYCRAERLMSVSGDPDIANICPRSQPFPQPPHHGSAADRIMKASMPEHHFIVSTARPRQATTTRSACCANLTCSLCPANAKFSVDNGFADLLTHPQVDICLNSEVRTLQADSGSVQSATFRSGDEKTKVSGDLFVLGANTIQSPAILLRSGINSGAVGEGIHEQKGVDVEIFLKGLANLDGSTIFTGMNYRFYDGEFRRHHAACLVNFENRWSYGLRPEPGRWSELQQIMIHAEDIPQAQNRVTIDPADGQAVIEYQGESDYALRGIDNCIKQLPELLAALPVESINVRRWRDNGSHLHGTLRMGAAGDGSVADHGLQHHKLRNLVIAGTSVFPTSSPANPSLTAAALSLRAAERIFG